MTLTGCSNPECYAQALCDCHGPVNREHVVSASLLQAIWPDEPGGLVRGYTFLRRGGQNNPAPLGIKSLTAYILCKRHNELLSPFDTEMTKFFKATEQLMLDCNTGERTNQCDSLNGDHLERWMLKTLSNGLFSGNFPVPFTESFAKHLPPVEYLNILYRNAPFSPGCGLYVAHDQAQIHEHVFCHEVVGAPNGIVGLRMWVFGSLYTLVLSDEHGPFPELANATYRPSGFFTPMTGNSILLHWAGAHSDTMLQLDYSVKPSDS